MGLAHSPKIVTDGLVFAYDMGNADKSWKGKPTTNLTPNLGIVNIQAAPTTTYVGVENGWKKYSLNGTWTAGTYPYSIGIDAVAFTGGVSYSSGVYIKTNVPTKFANLFGGMNYVNEPMNNGGTSFSIPQSDGSFFVGRTGFQYTSTTTQIGYILSQPVVGQTFSSATDFIYIKDGQVETGLYTTPFTSGTRSNTQALLDLTKQNIVTATSLTYDSSGTFSYSGSDYITLPNIASYDFSSEQTIEIWLKPTENDGGRRNPYNQAYGGYGTWTHEPAGVFNYYYGDSGINNQPYVGHTSSFTVSQNEIACVCTTRNTSESWWYKNGVADTQYTHSFANLAATSADILIGTGYAGGYIGDIYAVKIYNRALSAAEVQQNFNALRGRFGI